MPSITLPLTSLGPVQPFLVLRTIIGQIGLSSLIKAFSLIFFISSITLSNVLAISSWILSLSSTIYGLYPQPLKKSINSSLEIRAKIVGFAILYPFKCNIGRTTPSFFGFINLLPCQLVARGPVSASPSPTTQVAIKSGLSRTAPKAWARL